MIFDLSEALGPDAVVVPVLSEGILDELYRAAESVPKLQPWKKLDDTDLFGIRDPNGGETHIVSVLDAIRQVFAVNVYLPEEGIRFWNEFLRTGVLDQILGTRRMRMVSCEFISWNEANMDDTDMDRDEVLAKIPVFELKKNGNRADPGDWAMKVEHFPQAAPEPEFLPDELFAARLAAHKIKKNETWKIGSIHLPTPVVSKGRPRWLTATIVVSVNSGMVFGTELGHSAAPRENALRKAFLASVIQTEGISPENFGKLQEILNQYPHPHEMSPTEIAAMMYKIKAIEGADEVMGMAVEMSEETSPSPAPPSKERYIFRIELENLVLPVWRQLSIGGDSTFSDLHSAIQALFGWDGWHCHCFQTRKGQRPVSSIGPDELDDFSEWETPLSEVFKRKGSKIHYVYDFGDNWTHLVKQEGKVPAKDGETGPICLAGEGIAPPEDCGGIWGYERLLDPENDPAADGEKGYDPEFLKHLREGKFSPVDVVF